MPLTEVCTVPATLSDSTSTHQQGVSRGLSKETWPSCLSLHSDPLFSARECSLNPSGVAGVRGGQRAQATPLLEADSCLRSTSCAQVTFSCKRYLHFVLKREGGRLREVGSSRLRPSQIKVQQPCKPNAPPPPGTARSPSGKSTKNQGVRTTTKFLLPVVGKSICLKMRLGEMMLS